MKVSLKELKDSNFFLNTIFENITSAILLVDRNIEVQQFNEPFQILFNKREDQIIGNLCGNVIGCKYTIEEKKNCGSTSNCDKCLIRKSIMKAFKEKTPTFKNVFNRQFYIKDQCIEKYFQFTTKHITFNEEDMVIIILDDITQIEISKKKLEERNKMIESYHKRLKDELFLAKNVQQNLIPKKIPELEGISLTSIYQPLEEIGGDLYDFIKIDEDTIGIFLSDISGHGVPAAMVTAMVKAIMETGKYLFNHPAVLMSYLNKKLMNIGTTMYLTALYGIYNIKTHEFTYIRCGHPYPILIRNHEYIELKTGGSTVLGVFENINFESKTIHLKPKDKLIFYTDGLTESIDHSPSHTTTLKEFILKYQNENIASLIHHIYEDISEYKKIKDFEDDICILGMEVKI
ncbi:SpoIIE family protein phosphatase [Inediibacterium massiliense]|uniref:SpoIIE family protein phosphatase n=1 Tax=Inediibacterium massiliense TaxID=1658111 RepID=UPI0006B426BC|nr:SpoIIE family protein phosphatase [Inediibacterium massiliense]